MKKLKIAGQFSVEIVSEQLLFTWNIVFGGFYLKIGSKLNRNFCIVFSNFTQKVEKEG